MRYQASEMFFSCDGKVEVFSTETGKSKFKIDYYPGLVVHGCDFRRLHPESRFGLEDRKILRCYGAEVEGEKFEYGDE